jgi:hypothetical protein
VRDEKVCNPPTPHLKPYLLTTNIFPFFFREDFSIFSLHPILTQIYQIQRVNKSLYIYIYIYKRIHHATGVTRLLEQAAVLEKIHHGRKKTKKHDTPIESGDSNSSLYIDGGFYFEK